jgi:hypothetical protein
MKKLILIAGLCALALRAEGKPVNEYTPASTVNDTDEMYVYEVASPHDFYLTPLQLKTYVLTNVPGSDIATGTISAAKLSFALATVATSGSYTDLINLPTIPAAQINSDWNASSGLALILNKPTIPAGQVNSDWNATSGLAQILNKPTLATVATTGAYSDLSGKPTIPAAQVNSDWNASSGLPQVLNKPSLATVATSGSYNDLSSKPTIPTTVSQLTNDSGYLTSASALNGTNVTNGTVAASKLSFSLATVATSGSYSDLSSKPTIPTIPSTLSLLKGNGSGGTTNAAPGADYVAPNAFGYVAPNVNTSRSSFLACGFSGAFLSGRERAYLLYSGDAVNWANLNGLNNYAPPPYVNSTTGNTATTNTITSLASMTGINTNTFITSGPGITTTPPTFVTGVSGSTITLNQNTTATTNSAPFTFSAPTGLRDIDITKLGAKYFTASTVSYFNATTPYFDVASSPDMVTWTHVSSPAASGPATSPKWFFDPVGGGTWVVGYGFRKQNTSTTGGIPDGVTWGSDIAMTVSGITRGFGDEFLLYSGGTYIYLCSATGNPQTYHICTSSTLGGTYVDQGAPANWPTPVEGIRAYYDAAAGLYYAYFSSGQFSTSSTPTVPSSWSVASSVNSAPIPSGNPMASIDNGGGFCFNNDDTLRDVVNQMANQYWFSAPSSVDAPPQYTSRYPLNFGVLLPPLTGIGTIAGMNGWNLTGTGTQFSKQLQPGSIIVDNHGADGIVGWIVSDTSLYLMRTGSVALTAGDAFTYVPPVTCWHQDGVGAPSLNVTTSYTGSGAGNGFGGMQYFGDGKLNWYFDNAASTFSGMNWTVHADASGDWELSCVNNGVTPVVIAANSPNNSIVTTQTGGVLILGGKAATLPTAGSVGYQPSVSTTSATALANGATTNWCQTNIPAGHYLVSWGVSYYGAAATYSDVQAGVYTNSATLPPEPYPCHQDAGITLSTGTNSMTGTREMNFTGAVTLYGTVQANYSAGTGVSAYGYVHPVQLP